MSEPDICIQRLKLGDGVPFKFLQFVTAARNFAKHKYLEPMFSDLGLARTKARISKTVDC